MNKGEGRQGRNAKLDDVGRRGAGRHGRIRSVDRHGGAGALGSVRMNGTLAAVSGVALVCAIVFAATHIVVSMTRRSDLHMRTILAEVTFIACLVVAVADFARGANDSGTIAMNVTAVLLSGITFALTALAANLKGRGNGKK